METIVITPKNKRSIPFLKHLLSSLKEVESVEVVANERNISTAPKNRIAKSINSGLKDVKEMLSGKKKGKTLDQLLDDED